MTESEREQNNCKYDPESFNDNEREKERESEQPSSQNGQL